METQIIPRHKLPAVETAFAHVFGADEPKAITLLTGGLSSALIYKVTVQNKDYLLRIMMQVTPMNDPERQFQCMGLAADAGIAPPVYYTSVADGIAVTNFIAAKPVTDKNQQLIALAAKLRAIHNLPLFPAFVNFMDGIDMFITQFKAAEMFPGEATSELFELYANIQQAYPRNDADLVSSHNDLNPNNILFDGQQIWIIDWEAAFANDRYVDLAITALSFAREPKQQELLLAQYFGQEPTAYQRARFFLMQQVCLMYYGLMMFRLATAHEPSGVNRGLPFSAVPIDEFYAGLGAGIVSLTNYNGQLQYGKVLFNQLLLNMRSPQFQNHIRTIA